MSNITLSGAAPRIELPRVYAILDAARIAPGALPEAARGLVASGIRMIQYRDKRATSREMYEASRLIAEIVQAAGGIFIVNDRADVAWVAGADGVHLGQDDLPAAEARRLLPAGKVIGLSTHSLAQVAEADRAPVDYVAFGPIFATRSKERPDPVVGLAGLRAAREATRKPLVAIGGITFENAREVVESGADSVAVIDALLGAADLAERARQFLAILEKR
ncbi:MAG TPA: thiamine phosphate synthase [Terriglobia bacterium]|nr:thiamine phosphate synthase [Terriglobia bacterium]